MEIAGAKRYSFFIGVGVFLVALGPAYVFLVRPAEKEENYSLYEAVETTDKLTEGYINRNYMPNDRMIEAYREWHDRYIARASDDLNKLKAQSQKLHAYFEKSGSKPIMWREVYEAKVTELEDRIKKNFSIPAGKAPVDLRRFGGGLPSNTEINESQTKFWIAEELVNVLEKASRKAGVVELKEISFSNFALSQSALPSIAVGVGASVDEDPRVRELDRRLESGEIDMTQWGVEYAAITGSLGGGGGGPAPGGQAFEVERKAEQDLLGYQRRPFAIRLRLDSSGVPVLLSELLNAKYIVRINGMVVTRHDDSTANVELSCELLDFS